MGAYCCYMFDLDEFVNEELLINIEIIAVHAEIAAQGSIRVEKISIQGSNFQNYGSGAALRKNAFFLNFLPNRCK